MRDLLLYDRLYKESTYGISTDNHRYFLDFIRSNIEPPSSILDASCGRGNLLRRLTESGYNAKGTEISRYLIENDLKGRRVNLVDYHGISAFGMEAFEVVISCNVLDCIESLDLNESISNLCYISRKYVLISVGLKKQKKFPKILKLSDSDLCKTRKKEKWWSRVLENYINIQNSFTANNSFFAFGSKR